MKVFLPLFNVESTLGPDWTTPLAHLPVADATLIDHILFNVRKWRDVSVILPVTDSGQPLLEWCRTAFGDEIDVQGFVTQSTDLRHVLWECRSAWEDGDIVVDLGQAIIEVNLGTFARTMADVVCFVDEGSTAEARSPLHVRDGNVLSTGASPAGPHFASGLWWFRDGAVLRRALEELQSSEANASTEFSAGLLNALWTKRINVAAHKSDLYVPLSDDSLDPAGRLLAINRRLLGFGRHSENAIERSYGEDFTVLTPVYLHETATIDTAVVGPYTCVAAEATVRNSVVSNSIIGPGAIVEDAVLEGAVLGIGAVARGYRAALLVAERMVWELEGQLKSARKL